MRLLFAVHGYKPANRIGGPIYSVSALAERLVNRGHKIVVFTTNSNLDEDLRVATDTPINVDGVDVWYFRREGLRTWGFPWLSSRSLGFLYAPRMAEELERIVPHMDAVHTHMPFTYPSFAAARAAIRHQKPLFYHQRGVLDPQRLKFRSLKKRLYIEVVEKPIMRRATTLVALTHQEMHSYALLGMRTPCTVVPNGIDADWSSVQSPIDELAGVPSEAPVILFVGRMHPMKGPDLLLEAFVAVHSAIPEAVLILAGPDEFGLEATLRKAARGAGIEGKVIFPGMVSGAVKQTLFRRASLFCLPSVAEGFSVAVLEALASGVPVLLSPGCHFPEVEQMRAGKIVARCAASIGKAIVELLSDRDALNAMGVEARMLASGYDWNEIVTRMEQVYLEGVSRHSERVRLS